MITKEWIAIRKGQPFPVDSLEWWDERPEKAVRFTFLNLFLFSIPIACDEPISWTEYLGHHYPIAA